MIMTVSIALYRNISYEQLDVDRLRACISYLLSAFWLAVQKLCKTRSRVVLIPQAWDLYRQLQPSY